MGCRDYVALDLETTGLRPTRDRILEIGAVRVCDGEMTDSYTCLVDHGLPIPEQITELTGITGEMAESGTDLQSAVEGFLDFAGEAVLLGHNVRFDYSFMKRNVVNLGGNFERQGLDTLAIARVCLPALEHKSLDQLAAWYEIPEKCHHRALDDAVTAARLYERMREEFEDRYPALFTPSLLQFKVRREGPITNSQKGYLRDLLKYHRISCNVKIDQLTKNEASRMIDGIILHYGKIKR